MNWVKNILWIILFALVSVNVYAATPILACDFDGTLVCGDGEIPVQSEKISYVVGLKDTAIKVGTAGVLSYPYQNNFDIQKGTISMWFKPDSGVLSSDGNLLFQHQSRSNNANLRFRILPESQNGACRDCYEVALFTGSGDAVASISLAKNLQSLNGWYYLATTWDSQGIQIYLNGKLVDEYLGNLQIGSPSDVIFVGSYPLNNMNAYGAIDNLRIYDQVLSSADILAEFQSNSDYFPATTSEQQEQVIPRQSNDVISVRSSSNQADQFSFVPIIALLVVVILLVIFRNRIRNIWKAGDCSICGETASLFSSKKIPNEQLVCRDCYKEWSKKESEKYVNKYVEGIPIEKLNNIIYFKNNYLDKLQDEKSLSELNAQFEHYVEFANSGKLTDTNAAINLVQIYKFLQKLLSDMINLKKLLEKKGVDYSYEEVATSVIESAEDIITKNHDSILKKYDALIRKGLPSKPTIEQVISRLLKVDVTMRDEEFISRALAKFGINASNQEIQEALKSELENYQLEEFEKDLGKTHMAKIKDFSSLSGREFENWLESFFEAQGYAVIRTKLVGDQGADLILNRGSDKVVVQAKKYDAPVGNKAIQEVVASKAYYKANNAMVVTSSTFTKSARQLAMVNHVELLSGTELNKKIEEINLRLEFNPLKPINEIYETAETYDNVFEFVKNGQKKLKESIDAINSYSGIIPQSGNVILLLQTTLNMLAYQLNNAVWSSLHSTVLSEQNKTKIPREELENFKEFYKKIEKHQKLSQLTLKEHDKLKKELDNLDKKGKLKNFNKILEKIENQIEYESIKKSLFDCEKRIDKFANSI